MGFLHKLWDETLAGPTPDSGLGKLRKYNSFSGGHSASNAAAPPPGDDHMQVSRSITIVHSNPTTPTAALRNIKVSADSASAPTSPAASSTPHSPFSPSTPGGNVKKFTRRKWTAAGMPHGDAEPKSPTGYDWIVLSALDR